ncbi:hypothetical protein [Chamaesiphon sp.]|uniref:hypothetical protein n=1 Tax=Chamaesiphon sp. TaxID=2814140 RepID=UPI003593708A
MMFKIFGSIIVAGLALSLALVYLPINMSRLFLSEDKIALSEDPDVVEREILRIIPIDSAIDGAKQMMEKNGFGCKFIKNGEFARVRTDRNAPGGSRQQVYRNVDYLYCDASQGFLVQRRWQLAIIHVGKQVKSVAVSTGLVGL